MLQKRLKQFINIHKEPKFSEKCKQNCKKISKILETRYGGI